MQFALVRQLVCLDPKWSNQLSVESNPGLQRFCFTTLCAWSRNSRHPLSQSLSKLKPIATWSPAFSRSSDRLLVFTLSSHWLLVIIFFVLIGRCVHFGFGFTTLNQKALYIVNKPGCAISKCSGLLQQGLQL